ncbi:recombinase family protein [Bifidobacterium mongoliense]|uniref:recombinase family protein n=1 Tax=Bifidobacterium mongoliense TaxID=518643 RepID=UPI002649533B|nr:recombinase family protein [Bifidobacterium mongoliense]MDN6050554.1 recombinase family protein [Bifidobacterium mongoliense]
MKIGYIRVSTTKQALDGTSLDDQRKTLHEHGVETIYEDAGRSGKNTNRPGLGAMQKALHDGDVVVVVALDRLGRNLKDIAALIQDWQDRGITLIALREGINTNTATGVMVAQIMGMVAELERKLILERTQAGREASIASGKIANRPKGWTDRKALKAWNYVNVREWSITDTAVRMKTSRQTIYRMLDRANEIKAEVQA